MKKLLLSIIVFLGLTTIVEAQRGISAVALVPEKSAVVLRVDWAVVRTSDKLRPIVNGDSFSRAVGQIGLDETRVSEWVVFTDINPTSSRKMGMVVAGNFNARSIVRFARSKDWRAERIGAGTAYVDPADGSYILPVRDGLVAVGTKEAIGKVQDILARPRNSIVGKQPFASVWRQIAAERRPIMFFAGIPEDYELVAGIAFKVLNKLLDLASFGILGTIFDTIGLVRSFGYAVSYERGVFPTELVAKLDSEAKAWIAANAIELLKKTPSALGIKPQNDSDKKMFDALRKMSASYNGDSFRLKFEMPEAWAMRR
ncbi:MAG: hypothetical protein IPK58_15460 [Acidobacteria bacterium]|nr:hypothetical protein [Acidobacteriota bacterium]